MNGPITSTGVINDPHYWRELEDKRPKPRIRHGAEFNLMMNTQDSVGYLFRMQELQNEYDKIKMLQNGMKNMQSRPKSTERPTNTPYSTVTPLEEYILAPECNCGSHFIKVVTGYRPQPRQITQVPKTNKACQATPEPTPSYYSSSTSTTTASSSRNSRISVSTTTRTVTKCPIEHVNPNRNATFEYLKAHSKTGPPRIYEDDMVYPQIERVNTAGVTARVQIPRTKSASRPLERRNINYIRANAYALKETETELKKKRELEMEAKENAVGAMKHYRKGEVPNYLKRTKEAAVQFEVDNKPDKLDKVNMDEFIENLKEIREDLLGRLNSLPISMDSMRVQRQQQQINKNIDDVDQAIEYYRKKKIYLSNHGSA